MYLMIVLGLLLFASPLSFLFCLPASVQLSEQGEHILQSDSSINRMEMLQ